MADAFEVTAQAALERVGLSLGPGDLDLLRMVAAAFDTSLAGLDRADLSGLPLEPDLDPGRAPRLPEVPSG